MPRALWAASRQTYETSLGGDAGLAQLRAMVADARQAIAQLRAAIDMLGPEAGTATANIERVRDHLAGTDPLAGAARLVAAVRAALDKIDPLITRLDEIGDRIARGEGSLGRLLSDPEFPEDTKELGKIIKRHPWRILERPPK